jgi:hypothetical protein
LGQRGNGHMMTRHLLMLNKLGGGQLMAIICANRLPSSLSFVETIEPPIDSAAILDLGAIGVCAED